MNDIQFHSIEPPKARCVVGLSFVQKLVRAEPPLLSPPRARVPTSRVARVASPPFFDGTDKKRLKDAS